MGSPSTPKPRRIAVVGTGNVGGHAMRAIHGRPDLELVAARVYTDAKVGRDAGELIGEEAYGITATKHLTEMLEAQPDAVLYMPNTPDLDDICTILKAGVNVVATSGGHMFYPYSDLDLTGDLQAACQAGKASYYGAGVDPGYMSAVLPLSLSSWCRRIDRVKMTEVAMMIDYPSATTLFDLMHFGHPLDPENCRKGPIGQRIGRSFEAQVAQIVAGLGAVPESINLHYEEIAAPHRLHVAAGVIEEGTLAGQRWRWSGVVDGAPLAEIEVNWIMSEDLPGWPSGYGWWVDIDGDPDIHSTVKTAGGVNADDECCIATAMQAVNALQGVCAAAPGVVSLHDLSPVTGRYIGRAPALATAT